MPGLAGVGHGTALMLRHSELAMLTKLIARNFKLFDDVEIELSERVVFVGPNNSGKTSALQALALWSIGVRRWLEKRGGGNVPKKRAGVTINRRDLIAVPVPAANLLWRDLHTRDGYRENGETKTKNVLLEVTVEGIDAGASWAAAMEFDYANEESLYCRAQLGSDDQRLVVPAAAGAVKLAYLPPMSGLAANETRLDEGALDVRIGEGRTAEVLRNLCWQALQRDPEQWRRIVDRMTQLFGVTLHEPRYVKERGEIAMTFGTVSGTTLDLSASGRGQQQTLLLLAHMAANCGATLLLDEPDAHLEVLRQRQIYSVLTEAAADTGSQIIAASHSEVILNEAADRDTVVAFVGKPHRIDDRGSQVLKALKEIGFEHYLQAELTGWVLYLEGSTDLAMLRAFAHRLRHRVVPFLERPYVHYVCNQSTLAQRHFHGLREAKPDLVAIALYDRLEVAPSGAPNLEQVMWRRREFENYVCQRETLLAFASAKGKEHGELFAAAWRTEMAAALDEVEAATTVLGKGDPWGPDFKVSDDFLDPLFKRFYAALRLPNLMRKTDYHTLVPFVPAALIDGDIGDKLDAVLRVAQRATAVKRDA
jgi:energy-coupling factor transporter ATP-binding protein EcfA2